MLALRNMHVWAYPGPTDLRRGFNGLLGLVEQHLSREILFGDLYLFVSRNRRSAKVLYWDGTGLVIFHKKLARGTFPKLWSRPGVELSSGVELTMNELNLFLEGCKLLERQALSPKDLTLNRLAS